MSRRTIEQVMNSYVDELMSLKGVVGVAIGMTARQIPCIQVLVIDTTEELQNNIPSQLEGHPVTIVVTGEIRGMSNDDE